MKLPENWTIAELGVLATYINGRAFKPSEWKIIGLPIVRIQNLNSIGAKYNFSDIEHEKKYKLNNGDLLVAWSASLGAYIWNRGEAWLNQHIFKVEICENIINKKFLFYAIQEAIQELYSKAHGSGMVHVTKPVFEAQKVPLPPLAEQKRIADKLDELLSRVDACKERLKQIPGLIKRFRQSVLNKAFTGELTKDWRLVNNVPDVNKIIDIIKSKRMDTVNAEKIKKAVMDIYKYEEREDNENLPETWKYIALKKICYSFDYGTSKKSNKTGKVPVIRMGNIQNGSIDWSDLVYSSNTDEIERYKLEPLTVLFNRTNSPELVGKTAIYKGEQPAIFAGYLIRINYFPELNPFYLNYFLNSLKAKDYCMSVKTDGVSQSNINATKLANFEIPFCSIEEQKEIVQRIDSLFSLADSIENRYNNAKKYIDKLTPSILAKAFRGELVEQNPDDEPANVLLERILRERGKG